MLAVDRMARQSSCIVLFHLTSVEMRPTSAYILQIMLTVIVEHSALSLYQQSVLLTWHDHIKAVHSKLRSASMHLKGCSDLVGCAHDAASCQGMPVPGGHLTGL